MPKQWHDPITNTLRDFERVDYTDGAYRQEQAPNALLIAVAERLVHVERRGG